MQNLPAAADDEGVNIVRTRKNASIEGTNFADTINGGEGNAVVYGDTSPHNLLAASISDATATSFKQFDASGNWSVSVDDGKSLMSQKLGTEKGVGYTVSFELAANIESERAAALWKYCGMGKLLAAFQNQLGLRLTQLGSTKTTT
jgi:hypothetical protein